VAAFDVLRSRKNVDLFRKYGVLNKAEYGSRIHIAVEKYVKQLHYRGGDDGLHGQRPDPAGGHRASAPAGGRSRGHQGGGREPCESATALKEFVALVDELRRHTTDVERAASHP
jgi:hypothetical protein